jgi:hypothetical protein
VRQIAGKEEFMPLMEETQKELIAAAKKALAILGVEGKNQDFIFELIEEAAAYDDRWVFTRNPACRSGGKDVFIFAPRDLCMKVLVLGYLP